MNNLSGPTTTAIRKKVSEIVSFLNTYVPSGLVDVNQVSTGLLVRTQAAPVNSNIDPATKSTMASSFITGLLTATPEGNINYTLPTGTQMDTACAGHLSANEAFEFNIINIGAGGIITFVAADGFTIV